MRCIVGCLLMMIAATAHAQTVDQALDQVTAHLDAINAAKTGYVIFNNNDINSVQNMTDIRNYLSARRGDWTGYLQTIRNDYATMDTITATEPLTQAQITRIQVLKGRADGFVNSLGADLYGMNNVLAYITVLDMALQESGRLRDRGAQVLGHVDQEAADMLGSEPNFFSCYDFENWWLNGGAEWVLRHYYRVETVRQEAVDVLSSYQGISNFPAWMIAYVFGNHIMEDLAAHTQNLVMLWNGALNRLEQWANWCYGVQDVNSLLDGTLTYVIMHPPPPLPPPPPLEFITTYGYTEIVYTSDGEWYEVLHMCAAVYVSYYDAYTGGYTNWVLGYDTCRGY